MLKIVPYIVTLIVTLGILQLTGSYAYSDDLQFQKCNQIYSQGNYQDAINCYRNMTGSAGFSVGQEYNLANSYAQNGDIGQAILHYERALRLAPGDSDAKGNLAFIRKESGLFPAEKSLVESVLQSVSPENAALVALFSMLALTVITFISIRSNGRKTNVLRTGFVSFTILTISALFLCWKNYQSYNPSVVVAKNVRLLISPFDGAGQVGAIDEGRLVRTSNSHGDYTYVVDETGKKGWLPSSSIAQVIP